MTPPAIPDDRAQAERAALLEIRAAMYALESGLMKYGRITQSRRVLLFAKLLGIARIEIESEYQLGAR